MMGLSHLLLAGAGDDVRSWAVAGVRLKKWHYCSEDCDRLCTRYGLFRLGRLEHLY